MQQVRILVDYANITNVAYRRENQHQESEVSADSSAMAATDKIDAECQRCLSLIMQKDEQAMADFYDATIAKVYAIALHITGFPEAAEEVVEDVYMQVWREAEKYDVHRSRVTTWLITICRSRALDHLRRSERAETHPDPVSLQPFSEFNEENPIDLLMVTERDHAIHAAIKALPAIQRQLLALAFFKGLSHQQIANHTEMPLGTVKTHIRQAITCLQQTTGLDDQRFEE